MKSLLLGLAFVLSVVRIPAVATPNLPARQLLDAKLVAQWARFETARKLALEKPVEREEWEKALALSPSFTSEELQMLTQWQQSLAAAAKAKNEKASALSLDALRHGSADRIKQFCADFPKGGQLHVHDWGTMSEAGMADLLARLNPVIRPLELRDTFKSANTTAGAAFLYPNELTFLAGLGQRYGKEVRYASLKTIDQAKLRDLFFLAHGAHPFPRFEAIFALIGKIILDKPSLDVQRLLYDDYFARAQAQNVSYVEIAAPGEISAEAFKALDAWAGDIQRRFGVIVRVQHTFFRARPVNELSQAVQKLLSLTPPTTMVGVNLVNNETDTPALEKVQPVLIPLLRASKEGRTRLHRNTHAGEMGDVRNVRDSLILGAERIGHGVMLRQDPVTLEYARLLQTPVEANLSSNVRLGVVKSYREHPYLYFLRLGLKVSLSTDDEGIFGTDINRECVHAIAETDINYRELRQLVVNSLSTSFAEPEERAALEQKLETQLAAFEGRWKALTH